MPINLDHNATTQPSPAVVAAVGRALTEHWHNPSSVHRAGQEARRQVELARQAIADLIHARARDITLTSGGTESIDLAIRGLILARSRPGRKLNIVTSRVEHAAIRDLVEDLDRTGAAEARWACVDSLGVVDAESVSSHIDAETAVVAVQWANNETGTVQPVRAISRACRERGVPFLCDATQWIGKMPVGGEGEELPGIHDFDLMALSPHKFHGPKGVGCLWVRQGVRLRPVLHGSQELGRRAGTENVAGIVGAGVAATEAKAWLSDASARQRLGAMRDELERAVLARVPGAVVNGPVDPAGTPEHERRRVWNTTNIGFPKLEAEALLLLLSERGVWASAGAACSSGSLDPSPVLLAMGIPPDVAHGSLRFSIGRHTTRAELAEAADIIVSCAETLARSMPGPA